ncbi:MAG: M56 family metallopeptidase [Lewinellaceae bacterium]|nr:M56 family metallopeptidase [Lewinellaceae bacterium]
MPPLGNLPTIMNIQYIIESAFCLACLYGFYWLVLQRETFFQWNRVYLLLSPLLALALPTLKIQVLAPPPASQPEVIPFVEPVLDLPVIVEQVQAAPVAVRQTLMLPLAEGWSVTLGEILWWTYLAGAGLLTLRLAVQMWYLLRMMRRCRKVKAGKVDVVVSEKTALPVASFFGIVFWNHESQLTDNQEFLLEHELVHVRQWHSIDVLLMELMVILQWFNPLMHAFRRSLCAVHEYIADDHVVNSTRRRYEYASLLVQHQSAGQRARPGLVNTFHSLIKNRLVMLAKRPSRPFFRVKYLLMFPLFAALMLLFSFRLIEKLPAAAPFVQAVKTASEFAGVLSAIEIIAEKTATPEPTSYNFYWGSIQCKIYHNTDSDTYFGEANLSPEEFREALKREPRIWNGQSLEQHLSFLVGALPVRSDYNDESAYAGKRAEIEHFAATLKSDDVVELNEVNLPNGKTAVIRLSMNAGVAGWLPRNAGEINALDDPAKATISEDAFSDLKWGKTTVNAKGRQFFTVSEFLDIIRNDPQVVYADGRTKAADSLSIWAAIPGNGYHPLLRLPATGRSWFSIAEIRAKIEQVSEQIKPGVVVRIAHKPEREDQAQRPLLELYPRSVFSLVPDGDPRLPLLRSDRRDYYFEWGNFSRQFPDMYAKVYTSGEQVVHADLPYNMEVNPLTAKEIIQMLKLEPRLFQEKEPLRSFSFQIKYADRAAKVENGVVPADFLAYFEKNVKDHDRVMLSNFRAEAGGRRTVATTEAGLRLIGSNNSGIKEIRIDKSRIPHQVFIDVAADQFESMKEQLKNAPDTWFQLAGIDLSHVAIELDVKPQDPKPPLPVSEYLLQWGQFTMGLGNRTAPGAEADTLIFPLYGKAELKAMAAAAPQILRNGTAAKNLRFQLRCGNLKPVVTETGVTGTGLVKLNKRIDEAELLWLSDFEADGIALRPVVMLFYPSDIIADRVLPGTSLPKTPFDLTVHPNPAREKITLSFYLPKAGKGRLSIVNALGQEVYSRESDFQAGEGSCFVQTRDLKGTGSFFAILETPEGKAKRQFIVL